MKKVAIRGPLLSISGYGVHARQVYTWLKSREDVSVTTQITPWGNTTFMINPDSDPVVRSIMADSNNKQEDFDVSVQIQLPDEWDPKAAKHNIGVTAAVETDKCNPLWVTRCNEMDHVVVPSKFTEGVLRSSGNITTNLSVVHEAYDESIVSGSADVELPGSFNFLLVSQLTAVDHQNDRKNVANTIKWFCETFRDDPDVGLVIKTNLGRATSIDRMNTSSVLKRIVDASRKGPYPHVSMVHGNMSSEELGSLYRHPSIKCLINLTRGEGFGLPILEAAVNGLPVIATNWSGHLDILSLGKFIPIDYSLQPIPDEKVDGRIFVAGVRWANPSEEDFKRRVKKFRSSFDTPRTWAADLQPRVRQKFSMSNISTEYDKVLGCYL